MKPLLLLAAFFLLQTGSAQSLDYLSVRKGNDRVVKNFYAGSDIQLQLADGSYLGGPVQSIRSDSVFVTVYDIRYYPTVWGTYMRDTVAKTLVGLRYKDIQRIYLNRRRSFFQRTAGPLLMLGGAGYFTLNVLNGAFFDNSLADRKNVKHIGIAAGMFGLGYLLKKLFASDGFSTKRHHIVYVDL